MRLLIVGKLNGQIGLASKIAIDRGARVKIANDIDSALIMLRDGMGADLIMIDVLSDIKYLAESLESEKIFVPIVACGTDNNKEDAIRAIKSGAKEYIPLPPDEKLIAAVFQAISEENRKLLYKSTSMDQVVKIADKVAKSEATILITGASGVGKEIMSLYIHQNSKRASKPMICVNCAAIPENLLESELFGHEKGSFTGAIARRIGKFEEANNGTLLLDEISEIDIKLQAKLLRAIQEQEIDRIGGTGSTKINIRIIATSNRDLRKEVQEGRFREDLYFRLNIINLNLPGLNERKEDILYLADYFNKKYSGENNIKIKEFSEESKDLMLKYNWPGNVRELENTIYRAVLLAENEKIQDDDLMIKSLIDDNFQARSISDVEKDLIISTLKHCLGDKTNAANILGISLNTLKKKLQDYTNPN